MLRYFTAGESHGPELTAFIEGIPAGLPLVTTDIDYYLARRQRGYGRGDRMQIEQDHVQFRAGVRGGVTTGAPIVMVIANRDWANWQDIMSPDPGGETQKRKVTKPRPGHADLAGGIKYRQADLRNILERSSARETAARVALGAVAGKLLQQVGIRVYSHVVQIGPVVAKTDFQSKMDIWNVVENSPVRCGDPQGEKAMMEAIADAKIKGDTLGGVFEIIVTGLPVGLGSHVQWDRRLDGRLAQALMSVQAVKGVEIGIGFASAGLPGSAVHDEIFYNKERGFYRTTNRAGGIEGGITNGEPLIVRGAMKPIPTLMRPLASVDIQSKQPLQAAVERSDVCAVPAAAVVGEAMVALTLAESLLERFSADHVRDLISAVELYRQYIREEWM